MGHPGEGPGGRMVRLSALTSVKAVVDAMAEFDAVGREAFMATYGYGLHTRYVVEHEGRRYDAKALAGVAIGYQLPEHGPLTNRQLSGGVDAANGQLTRLGFRIVDTALENHPDPDHALIRSLIARVGKLSPFVSPRGQQALHRPLLLLWALGQVAQGAPRLQSWSSVRAAFDALDDRFGNASDQANRARYPFAALVRDQLWEVSAEPLLDGVAPTRWTSALLDDADPKAGLPVADYDLLVRRPDVLSWVAATVLVKFCNPVPPGLLNAIGLHVAMGGRVAESMRPPVGDQQANRDTLQLAYGGQGVRGIGGLGDGILSAWCDEDGPYADSRIPGTDLIAYVGDGLDGDQKLTDGNAMMQIYQTAQRPLRYWHRSPGNPWLFESWVVITSAYRRWGIDRRGVVRREYVWVLAPVPSPLRDTWPTSVLAQLAAGDTGILDDTVDEPDADLVASSTTGGEGAQRRRRVPKSPAERAARYAARCQAADDTEKRRTARSVSREVAAYFRSPSARSAVIERSEGRCENPACLGHPLETTSAGDPILEVDHVHDLARDGRDHPSNMIALCPNCHALKTRGQNRRVFQQTLAGVVARLHEQALGAALAT